MHENLAKTYTACGVNSWSVVVAGGRRLAPYTASPFAAKVRASAKPVASPIPAISATIVLQKGKSSRGVTLLGESLQTRARAPPRLAVAQSEFARFVHLARKALNIKLGLSNAMLSLFSHMGDFTPVHAKTIILQHSGPDALRCAVLQQPSDGAVHCDPARAARTTHSTNDRPVG